MSRYPKPYECSDCSAYPDTAFRVFRPANDWIMTFPDRALFHVHFGAPTSSAQENTEQADVVAKYYYHRIHEYPQTAFFFILDMSQIDNSELVSDRAKQIYRILLQHPQLAGGAVYGATTDMQAMIRLLSEEADKSVGLVQTKAKADALYRAFIDSPAHQPPHPC